ncbi:hypothetical protein C8A06_1190 [Microbacteriaceae bacterium MWH-Ta3]|nr:hypothetical protein C8A06_1190 [Microbacteriaceae bacterium MWH-Ta3]
MVVTFTILFASAFINGFEKFLFQFVVGIIFKIDAFYWLCIHNITL